MEHCEKCEKEFDPSLDVCEDTEMLESVMYFVDVEGVCGDCVCALADALSVAASDFLYEVD